LAGLGISNRFSLSFAGLRSVSSVRQAATAEGANLKMKDVTERINISEKKRRDLSNFPESVKLID